MPRQDTRPPRYLASQVTRLHTDAQAVGASPKITSDIVTAVNGDGTYQVSGSSVSVTGERQIEVGEVVEVAWDRGAPQVILAHSARRGGWLQPPPQGNPFVEQLFLATNPKTGLVDVWFRNYSVVRALGLSSSVETRTMTEVYWGDDGNSFVVATQDHFLASGFSQKYFLFHLSRPKNHAQDPQQVPRAVPDTAYDLALDTTPLLPAAVQVSWSTTQSPAYTATCATFLLGQPAPPSFISPEGSGGLGLQVRVLPGGVRTVGKDRHLLVALVVWVNVTGANGGNRPAFTVLQGTGVVLDVTAGRVVLSGADRVQVDLPASPAVLADLSTVDWAHVPNTGGQTTAVLSGARLVWPHRAHGTTGALQSWLTAAVGGHQETQKPNVVLSFSLTFPWNNVTYVGLAHGGTSAAVLESVTAAPMSSPWWSYLLAVTDSHVLWSRAHDAVNAVIMPAVDATTAVRDPGNIDPAPPWHVTVLGTGSVDFLVGSGQTVTYGSVDAVMRRALGLGALRPDLLYQIDDAFTRPGEFTGLAKPFFIKAWAGKTVTLNTDATTFPVPNTALTRVAPLAKLPAGVVPLGSGSPLGFVWALHAVQDQAGFALVGLTPVG